MNMTCSLTPSQIFFNFQSKGFEHYSLDYAFYVFCYIVKKRS